MVENRTTSPDIDGLNLEARRALDSGDYPRALQSSAEALQIARAAADLPAAATALATSGFANFFLAGYVAARECGEEAMALYADLGEATGQIRMLYLLGIVHREIGDLTAALEYHQRQLDLSLVHGTPDDRAQAYSGMGGVFYYMGEVPQAIAYSEKALAQLARDGSELRQMLTLSNLLELCVEDGQIAHGVALAEQQEELLVRFGDAIPPKDHVVFCSRAARLHLAAGDVEQAADHAAFGLALAEANGLARLQAMLLEQLSDIAQRRGDLRSAIDYAERSVAVGEARGFADWTHTCLEYLATLWGRMGDYTRAYHYQVRYTQARMRVLNEEKEKRLRQIEARYEVERAHRETQFYRQEAERIDALREHERLAHERLARLKDELLATTTHDMKNPLTSIRIAAEMARRRLSVDAAGAERYLVSIDEGVERITALIGDVLDLARLEAGHTLNQKPWIVNAILDWAVRGLTLVARDKGVALTWTPADPALAVICDYDRVQQILANLIGNAIKYTPAGGQVEIVTDPLEAHVRFCVRDTGLGIPEDALPHIFEPFYRVKEGAHMTEEGTGLGLTIVHTLVEQHGGTIEVDSVPGGGSSFSFTLMSGAAPSQ